MAKPADRLDPGGAVFVEADHRGLLGGDRAPARIHRPFFRDQQVHIPATRQVRQGVQDVPAQSRRRDVYRRQLRGVGAGHGDCLNLLQSDAAAGGAAGLEPDAQMRGLSRGVEDRVLRRMGRSKRQGPGIGPGFSIGRGLEPRACRPGGRVVGTAQLDHRPRKSGPGGKAENEVHTGTGRPDMGGKAVMDPPLSLTPALVGPLAVYCYQDGAKIGVQHVQAPAQGIVRVPDHLRIARGHVGGDRKGLRDGPEQGLVPRRHLERRRIERVQPGRRGQGQRDRDAGPGGKARPGRLDRDPPAVASDVGCQGKLEVRRTIVRQRRREVGPLSGRRKRGESARWRKVEGHGQGATRLLVGDVAGDQVPQGKGRSVPGCAVLQRREGRGRTRFAWSGQGQGVEQGAGRGPRQTPGTVRVDPQQGRVAGPQQPQTLRAPVA